MAAGSCSSSSNSDTNQQVDRITLLYPKVDETKTPLPRSWSSKDKYSLIGLSQNNLKVHYKGKWSLILNFLCCSPRPKTNLKIVLKCSHVWYFLALQFLRVKNQTFSSQKYIWRAPHSDIEIISFWDVCICNDRNSNPQILKNYSRLQAVIIER